MRKYMMAYALQYSYSASTFYILETNPQKKIPESSHAHPGLCHAHNSFWEVNSNRGLALSLWLYTNDFI